MNATSRSGPKSFSRQLWRFAWLTGLAALSIHPVTGLGQGYPAKPIRIVVAFAPGGALDNLGRLVGQNMADSLKQPFIIENRPGADGRIGADVVAKAAPDGYTILLTPGILAVGPALFRKMPFDTAKDFAPISQLLAYTTVLVVAPKSPVASVRELIALAKSRPGALNYAHPGMGSQMHLGMELLKLSTGMDILPIPYKGAAPMQLAMMSGEVDVAFTTIGNAVQWVKSGRARALGVSSARRSAALPDAPTIAEAGVPGFEADSWYGLLAPAKTPRPVLGAIQQAASKAIHLPAVRARLEALGNEIVGSTPEEFQARFQADIAKYARVVKEARIPQQD